MPAAPSPIRPILAGALLSVLAANALPIGAGPPRAGAARLQGTDGLDEALASLAARDAGLRARARASLGRLARRENLAEVAAAARDGSAAIREGVAVALAAEDTALPLTVLLAIDVDSEVASVGRRALRGQILRWRPELADEPLGEGDVPPGWWDDRGRRLTLDLRSGSLADVVDRLDRLGDAPVPLVLDPRFYPGVRRLSERTPDAPENARFDATWLELVSALGEIERLSLRVHGVPPFDDRGRGDLRPGPRGAAAFVALTRRGIRAGDPAVERIATWCEALAAPGDPALQAASARAVATLRWPAGITWLADRWLATGDAAALEGTLAAAARGLVDPRLVEAAVVRAWLDEVDRRLARHAPGSVPFAERVARALAAFPPVDVRGEALARAVLDPWPAELDPVGAWARLVVLEGLGPVLAEAGPPADGSASMGVLRRVLADGEAAEPLVLQALRTWVATARRDAPPPRVAASSAVRALLDGGGARFADLLVASRAVLPEAAIALPAAGAAAPGHGPREALLRWAAARLSPARGDGLDLPSDSVARAALLAAARAELGSSGGRARLVAAARAAAEEGHGAALSTALRELANARAPERPGVGHPALDPAAHAVLLESGLASPAERQLAFDAVREGPRGDGSDRPPLPGLELLPGLVADLASGAEARALLVERVRAWIAARPAPLAEELATVEDVLERASLALRRARMDVEEETLAGELRAVAGRAGHPLARRLFSSTWPPTPVDEPVDLGALDRRWR